jgi:CRP/FNR family transcriptional regulator, anaerobic regulatory protein
MSYCASCIVRNRAICAALDPDEIEALNAIGRRRVLRAGESLVWEGEDSVLVANVIEGVFKLASGMEDGREQIVGMVYPSDFIGRPFAAVSGQSVTAMTDATICVFPRVDFEGFAANHPGLEHRLLKRTLAELDRTRQWMLLLGRKSAAQKVASFLVELAERLGEGSERVTAADEPQPHALTLPFSRQQIADVLGLTIETVSRQLTRLRQTGVIDLPSRRKVVILDPKALADAAG